MSQEGPVTELVIVRDHRVRTIKRRRRSDAPPTHIICSVQGFARLGGRHIIVQTCLKIIRS